MGIRFSHCSFFLLADAGLLTFDDAAVRWSWDISRIHAKGYTANVVALMVGKLTCLPVRTQVALQKFACVGNSSKLSVLETICELSSEALGDALLHAVRAGLVLSAGEHYRFLHDRVQEAAYALVFDAARTDQHLRIARLLLLRTPPGQLEENVFDIVSQFNRAIRLITNRAERERIASHRSI